MSMAESADKQVLSALTEGHEKSLRSSARNSTTISSSSNKQNNTSSKSKKIISSGQNTPIKRKNFHYI